MLDGLKIASSFCYVLNNICNLFPTYIVLRGVSQWPDLALGGHSLIFYFRGVIISKRNK